MTFRYDPTPAPLLTAEPGVSTGYVVMWSGETGPAQVISVAALHDEAGHIHIEATGDWQDAKVVAD